MFFTCACSDIKRLWWELLHCILSHTQITVRMSNNKKLFHHFIISLIGYSLFMRSVTFLLHLSFKSHASLGVIASSGGDLCCGLGASSKTNKWLKSFKIFTGSWVHGHGLWESAATGYSLELFHCTAYTGLCARTQLKMVGGGGGGVIHLAKDSFLPAFVYQ